MSKWTTYIAPVLALVFAFAVLSPVCCARDWSEFGTHTHQKTGHKKDDHCSDPVLQALIKPSCTYSMNSSWDIAFYIPESPSLSDTNLTKPLLVSSGNLNITPTGPSIHLLNKVFLN
ncbi:MAG TPA: hypothetical protein VJ964_09890 [Balneolaceae bacterium]|nr:hypothetical protein [Balneolaceae bacterium]